jgi:purine-binding chemotaxis protein CheW
MTDTIHTASDSRRELISFRIGEQEFCVDIMAVREIRGWTKATPLPHSPSFVRGVINLRGAVLPIMDLSARLGLGAAKPSARSVIIVVRLNERMFGMLVDAVSDILSVTDDVIQPTPDMNCDRVKSFVRGIITIDERMISQIALEALMPELEAQAA